MSHDCKYESQWERVFDSLEKQSDNLKKINDNLIVNNQHLAEHMKRTALLEDSLKPVRRAYDAVIWLGCIVAFVATIWKVLV